MDVTSTLSYLERTERCTTHVSVPGANAEMTFYEQLVNHDAVSSTPSPAARSCRTGRSPAPTTVAPFKISHDGPVRSDSDIAFESPWDVADAVWALSSMPGVVVDDVTINGDLVDDSSTWRVTRLQQNRGGRWVTLDRRHPAFGQAGGTLQRSRPARGRHRYHDGPPGDPGPDPRAGHERGPRRRGRRVVLVQRG